MTSESLWQKTVAAALIGTERQPFQPPAPPGNLGAVVGQLLVRSPEAALLTTAAILALHQRAGWLPESHALVASACPPDEVPSCDRRATRLLQQMLQGNQIEFLPEWLERVAIAQQRIPDLYLPALLDRGRQQTDLRGAILPVLGQRGRWLAAQNPDWSYAVTVATHADWETGNPAARLLYLQSWRQQQPDQARSLLESTWQQESASDRAKFLDALQLGLSLADEPFLEAALDDRSKDVRRRSAALLARLPGSRLSQRMAVRVADLVKVHRRQEETVLEVTLPETCNQTMQRDGIQLKSTDPMGERAGWLQQLLIATPLTTWEQARSNSIQDLLAATQGHDWQDLLRQSWQQAALQQRNLEWAWAFLQDSLERGWNPIMRQLLGILPTDQQTEFAIQAIQTQRQQSKEGDWFQVLELLAAIAAYPQAWNSDLAHLSLATLTELMPWLRDVWYTNWRQLLQGLPRCLPPEVLPTALALQSVAESSPLAARGYPLIQDVQKLLAALEFRRDLQQAFST